MQCFFSNQLLVDTKTKYYKSKINNIDQSKLFRLVNGMFHTKSVTPLPPHDSSEELAEKFSLHFMDKIRNLRQKLQQDPVREVPSYSCHSSFTEFQNISMETVLHSIQSLPVL